MRQSRRVFRRALASWLLVAPLAVAAAPRRAEAFTVQVLAASELQVDPVLAPDRSSLALQVRLLDDRGRSLPGRSVSLQMQVDGVAQGIVTLAIGDDGSATHTVPLSRGQRVVDARVSYAGDGSTAAQERAIRVGLNVPYVTADVVVPPGGVELGGPPTTFVVALRVGAVVDFATQGVGVELREGDALLADGFADASGRAVLRVPSRAFREARVYRVRAVTSVDGERVEGPVRDVVVRARTAVSLVRVSDPGDLTAPVALEGVLVTTTGAPIPHASVRVVRGTVTVAGARTDGGGAFQVRLPVELLAEHDVSVRAVFEPTEPWFGASESPALALTGPAPQRIHPGWVLAPALVAAALAAAAVLRGRVRASRAPSAEREAPPAEGDRVEHVRASIPHGLRVRFVAIDRATSKPVEGVCARWGGGEWVAVTESVAVQPARRIEFEVGAAGYSPRKVTGEFSRPGEYVVRVQLRTWREELFERARPWLRRAASGESMPTLREALGARAATPAAVTFVAHVEQGCYAPEAPDARHIARADELAAAIDTAVPTLRQD